MTVIAFIRPTNAANTIEVCAPGSVRLPNNNDFCEVIARRITFSALFQVCTCELLHPNQTVEMGSYNYDSKIAVAPPWVDASFQLKCPQAWGYGGSVKNSTDYNDAGNGTKTNNNTANQPIKIKIAPINPSVNPTQGIFQLNGGGAEGYDLQLAWRSCKSGKYTCKTRTTWLMGECQYR